MHRLTLLKYKFILLVSQILVSSEVHPAMDVIKYWLLKQMTQTQFHQDLIYKLKTSDEELNIKKLFTKWLHEFSVSCYDNTDKIPKTFLLDLLSW